MGTYLLLDKIGPRLTQGHSGGERVVRLDPGVVEKSTNEGKMQGIGWRMWSEKVI